MPSKETEVGRDVVSAADCGVDRLAKARQGKARQKSPSVLPEYLDIVSRSLWCCHFLYSF